MQIYKSDFGQWKHLLVGGLNKPEIEVGGEKEEKNRKKAKLTIRCRELLLWKLKWEGCARRSICLGCQEEQKIETMEEGEGQ